MSDGDKIRYALDAAPKIMALKILNNVFEWAFYLALIFFAYNCDWCGGPRMW